MKNNLYNRFMMWPRIISQVLCLCLFIDLIMYANIALAGFNLAVIWVVIIGALIGIGSMAISIEISSFARASMTKSRLWEWGKWRFDSWDELWAFWEATPAPELNRLVGAED